jgi:hypothetical protein
MYKRIRLIVMALAMLLAGILASLAYTPTPAQAVWILPDNCNLVVNAHPVFLGPMNVTGCLRWNSVGNQYGAYAYMYVPQSYELYTRAEGHDVCDQGTFTVPRMSNATYAHNDHYNVTLLAVGVYANCVNGHDYQVCAAGSRKWTAASAWEYATGCKINPL